MTYDSEFRHASFSGTRTAVTPQVFIALSDAWSIGPSKNPLPWTHAYSPPDRFTPCSTTWLPLELTSLFPDTCNCGAVVGGGVVGGGVVGGGVVGGGVVGGGVVGGGVVGGGVPAPLHATPLRVKAVGAVLVPL